VETGDKKRRIDVVELEAGEGDEKQNEDSSDEPESVETDTTPRTRAGRVVKRRFREFGWLANLLTADEIRQTYEGQKLVSFGNQGCMNVTLKPKNDGYVQVTIAGLVKGTARYMEFINSGGRRKKVLWHQVAWRYHNDFAMIPYNGDNQIAHTCANKRCSIKIHLKIVSRLTNEEQKKCRYVYYDSPTGERITWLACHHVGSKDQCTPPLIAYPLAPVEGPVLSHIRYVSSEGT